MTKIDQLLDKTKAEVFLEENAGKYTAFLCPLMCSCKFTWNDKIKGARTNGTEIQWNPDFFTSLNKKGRTFVLLHELWHIARLHALRKGSKDHKKWNMACDIRINEDLFKQLSIYKSDYPWALTGNHFGINVRDKPEEDIYKEIPDGTKDDSKMGNDIGESQEELTSSQKQDILNAVTNAVAQAQITQGAGTIPGDINETLTKFLKPVVPWKVLLEKYLTDLGEKDWTWKRPNRRFQDIYLPSLQDEEGRLEHLMFFLDVSGSINQSQVNRFCSEVKYIQEIMNPRKLSLIQFDSRIQHIDVYTENQPFNKISIRGRGGTSYRPVRNLILKEKPTAAVIFTDLYASRMEEVGKIPVIWIISDNPEDGPFGKSIHIKDE